MSEVLEVSLIIQNLPIPKLPPNLSCSLTLGGLLSREGAHMAQPLMSSICWGGRGML